MVRSYAPRRSNSRHPRRSKSSHGKACCNVYGDGTLRAVQLASAARVEKQELTIKTVKIDLDDLGRRAQTVGVKGLLESMRRNLPEPR